MSPAPPRVDPLDLPDLRPGELSRDRYDRDGERLTATGDVVLDDTSLRECEVPGLRTGLLSARGTTFVDCRLSDLQVTALGAPRSRWRRCQAVGGRIGSLDLSGSTVQSLVLLGLRLDYVNLCQAEVEDLLLEDCTIGSLDLVSATAARVAFVGCSADDVDLRHARLADVDLRGLRIGSVNGVDALRGTTVTADQAADLSGLMAGHLGIQVL